MLIGVDEEGGTVVRVSSNPKLRPQRFLSPQALYEQGGIEAILADTQEKDELLRFELEGTMVELEKDDVLTAPMKKPGYVVATDRGVTVALDTNLTEDLIAEGFAREVISKLQTMRKEAGFEVVDRIHVTVKTADEKLAQIVAQNAEAIERGVLALDVKLGDAPEGAYVRDWSINGVDATLSVLKA